MKNSLYTRPELYFIVLVMLLPLGATFRWPGSSAWSFIGHLIAFLLLGFCLWAATIWFICRRFDEQNRK